MHKQEFIENTWSFFALSILRFLRIVDYVRHFSEVDIHALLVCVSAHNLQCYFVRRSLVREQLLIPYTVLGLVRLHT